MSTGVRRELDGRFTLAPWNDGREPTGLAMLKVFSGKVFKTPRGSLRSFRVTSPVLVTVVVTFRFSNPLTLTSDVEVLRVRLREAETEAAEAMRAMREARREEENIVVEAVKGVETLGLKDPGLSSFPVLPIAQS